MNILLIVHHPLDPNTGAAGATLKVGQNYQQLGHTVHYYSFDDLPSGLSNLAQTVLFPEFVAANLFSLIKRYSIDVIDASTGDTWVWSKFFKKVLRTSPLLAVQSHGLEQVAHAEYLKEARQNNLHIGRRYRLYDGGFRLWEVADSLRHADITFIPNRRDADYAIKELGVAPDRVHVVTYGIPEYFLNLPFEFTSESSEAPIAIALMGTYIPRKGTLYSIPALRTILTRYPQVRVSFLGTCCPSEQVYADFEPALHDRVRVVPYYENEDVPALLKNHEVLLFPSLSEGFGIAILESMACGLTPIVTDIPGPTQAVNEENGIVIPVRDRPAIEHALEKLILNRTYLNQLRQKAYTTAQNYSWVQIARQRLAIYEEVLTQREHSTIGTQKT